MINNNSLNDLRSEEGTGSVVNPLKHIVRHVERTRNFDRILFLLRFYGSESKKNCYQI